jgi:hypothetical protein
MVVVLAGVVIDGVRANLRRRTTEGDGHAIR